MFPLRTFEKYLPPELLTDGRDIYYRKAVKSVESTESGCKALIKGRHQYHVEIFITDGEFEDWKCGCLDGQDEVCQHVVALLYALRDEANNTKKQS